MRARTLKPAFWIDEEIGTMGPRCRLLFAGLICHCDDEGRLRGNPAIVKAQVFPYDDVTSADVQVWLDELHARGRIRQYGSTDGSQRYIEVPNFNKHQYIKYPKPSELPAPHSKLPIRQVEIGESIENVKPDLENPISAGDSANGEINRRDDSSMNRIEQNRVEESTNVLMSESETSDAPPFNPLTTEIAEVIDHWIAETWNGRGPRPAHSQKRKAAVRQRIKRDKFTVQQLKDAVSGFAATRFYVEGKYLELATRLGSVEQVEKGLQLWDERQSPVPVVPRIRAGRNLTAELAAEQAGGRA